MHILKYIKGALKMRWVSFSGSVPVWLILIHFKSAYWICYIFLEAKICIQWCWNSHVSHKQVFRLQQETPSACLSKWCWEINSVNKSYTQIIWVIFQNHRLSMVNLNIYPGLLFIKLCICISVLVRYSLSVFGYQQL